MLSPDFLPTYTVNIPSTLIWFEIDPNIEFKHGQVGDIVKMSNVVKTNTVSRSEHYEILGVCSDIKKPNIIIMLRSTSTPYVYLTVTEGNWITVKNIKEGK